MTAAANVSHGQTDTYHNVTEIGREVGAATK